MFFLKKLRRHDFSSLQGSPEFIICGLGNPGTRYENTRHNCGFMALDILAGQEGFKIKKLKFKSLTALETIDGVKCFLMKPTTFMNRSGEALTAAMEFYKINPQNVIVIFDDYSLPLGSVKIRRSGSDGGHNGIKSIILESNSDNFPRVKIGIDRPPHHDFPLKDWVLSPFKKNEGEKLEASLERAAQAVRLMIKSGVDKAMNDFNGKYNRLN
ncbi:MAG: aminoacyl-tRNA hydrolase [Oscillospiraceae bacterium]|jgi:PTH1 family peptidyl-tRNA hydrolase|nr:aminoacyl-tRNA hydrolase [Oscillospiraceae bacterium]